MKPIVMFETKHKKMLLTALFEKNKKGNTFTFMLSKGKTYMASGACNSLAECWKWADSVSLVDLTLKQNYDNI